MNRPQRTLARPVEMSGVGIHSGAPARLRVLPAEPDTGRVLAAGGRDIPALVRHVVGLDRCITLGFDSVSISTVEHLLAAAAGLGLDNLRIQVEGPEIPIMDGSAAAFVEAFQGAGTAEQNAAAPRIELPRPLWVSHGDALVLALPHRSLELEYAVHFDHPLVGSQWVRFDPVRDSFREVLAPARTFGFWEEVPALRKQGLARGGDLSNALVITPDGFSTPPRFPDEPARHKCLDLLGDLALLGADLAARVVAVRAGHRLHVELVRKILEEVTVAQRH